MFDVVYCTKKGIRLGVIGDLVVLEFSNKKKYTATFILMMNISLTSRRSFCCSTLALPVKKSLIN